MEKKIRVLMCGSDIRTVKGGMVTVEKNYLEYPGWKKAEITFIPTHTEGNPLKKCLCFAGGWRKVLGCLIRKRADILHLHMAERGSFYRKAWLLKLGHRFGVPVVIHHHGAEFEDFYETLSEKKKQYVKEILEEADLNLVLSERLKQELLQKAPLAKTEVLHNAVPVPDRIPDRTNADRILMLGAQGKRKGSYDLLEAVAAIDKRLPETIKVWMCGDEDVAGVKHRVEELGLQNRIEHVGWIAGTEREECLSRAMLHVLPSYREGLPMSILETMGQGIPNISTRIASIPEVIQDGENGFLITPGDVEALQDRILKLVSEDRLRREFSEKGARLIREAFSLKASIERLEHFYEEICK